MKPAPFNLLLQSASRDNILTLTTSCSTACCFCSHHQNSSEVEAFFVNRLTEEETAALIDFLDGGRKIVIGESATRICEGEPFLCDNIFKILERIRKRYKRTLIQITTSGVPLDRGKLEKLKELGRIELNLSLNSSSEAGRRMLYNGKSHMDAVAITGMLSGFGIPFHGSIVAMPHIVGWHDIEATVLFLAEKGAETVRLFMPGYTRFSKLPAPPEDIRQALSDFAAAVRLKTGVPVLLEPPVLEDLSAVVEGVIKDSPGYLSGIRSRDEVLSVNGIGVFSRVDAYYKLYRSENPAVGIQREGIVHELTIKKEKNTTAGLVFNYDIHPDTVEDIKRVVRRNSNRSCLLLTSKLAYPILTACMDMRSDLGIGCVENGYFGGNIACAGLLTVPDILAYLEAVEPKPQVVLLPSIMFDPSGRDLLGRHYSVIEERFGILLEIV